MAALVYCGTDPVGPTETQAMLAGPFSAIWSPPMHRHTSVSEGDLLWLVWKTRKEAPRVLGGGIVLTPEGRVDWSNATAPGIVEAARALGYGGPSNMAFLRLRSVKVARDMPHAAELEGLSVGLAAASPQQVDVLARLLPL